MLVIVLMALGVSAGATSAAQTATPAKLASQLAVLRHAPTTNVPSAVSEFVQTAALRGVAVDLTQTRRVAGPDGGWWDVVPGAEGACFYNETEHVGACAPTSDVLAGRLSVQLVQPSGKDLRVPNETPRAQLGLLPDDAVKTTAVSALGSGTVSAKPNGDGLYRLSSVGLTEAVTMHRAGKRSVRLVAPKHGWPSTTPLARSAGCGSCPYWDGVPPGHFYTPWWFHYAVYDVGNWATIGTLDVNPKPPYNNNLCAIAQNPDMSFGGTWFCSYGYAQHDYGRTVRRGVGSAGAPSQSTYGNVGEYYQGLA